MPTEKLDSTNLSDPTKPHLKKMYSTLPSLPADGILHTRPGLSRTLQAPAAELNINRIVDRYLKTGQIPILTNRPMQSGDATKIPNLQEALQASATARQAYASLPLQLREETGHDPSKVEAWLRDPRNRDLAVKWGLLKPSEVPKTGGGTPPPVPPVAEKKPPETPPVAK